MYPKTTKRVHVTLDIYPKRAKRVHVTLDIYPKRAKRVHVVPDMFLFRLTRFDSFIYIGEIVVLTSLPLLGVLGCD